MSVRLPQSIDRLSSLSLGDSAPERKSPSHQRQPSDISEAAGLVQRCVIIQKDQHGFGFTVCGDRIVLVQSVRPGGAAMKAGVKEGDRIIKVNGTMVTNSSHLEVVKLIKCELEKADSKERREADELGGEDRDQGQAHLPREDRDRGQAHLPREDRDRGQAHLPREDRD